MKPVDYDILAEAYDRRYDRHRYDGTERCLHDFVRDAPTGSIAEVGCGTGHWLKSFDRVESARLVSGLDLSAAMLARARETAPTALLVRGAADELPWANATFDRVFCINALHHFRRHGAFFRECARVLRSGGGFLTIGLDPESGLDSWWVYDYFPGALAADRLRYPSTATIRTHLAEAGFRTAQTSIAQHMAGAVAYDKAEARDIIDRRSASQLIVISDEEWSAGLARMNAERPVLRADLRLYATTAWMG